MHKNSTHFLMRYKKTYPLLFIIFLSLSVSAQQAVIHGTVTSAENNSPLIGVTVMVKGSTAGTVTDAQGRYTIQASPQDTLIFRYIGFTENHVAAGNQSVVNVSLQPAASRLSDVIVTG